MEALYDLPSGDRVWVVDTATAARHLGTLLRKFREGNQEPLFYGDEPKPEGVVISFEQWVEYEALKEEAEADRRIEQIARERLAGPKPEDYSSVEEAKREGGWVTLEDLADELGWDVGTPGEGEDGPGLKNGPS